MSLITDTTSRTLAPSSDNLHAAFLRGTFKDDISYIKDAAASGAIPMLLGKNLKKLFQGDAPTEEVYLIFTPLYAGQRQEHQHTRASELLKCLTNHKYNEITCEAVMENGIVLNLWEWEHNSQFTCAENIWGKIANISSDGPGFETYILPVFDHADKVPTTVKLGSEIPLLGRFIILPFESNHQVQWRFCLRPGENADRLLWNSATSWSDLLEFNSVHIRRCARKSEDSGTPWDGPLEDVDGPREKALLALTERGILVAEARPSKLGKAYQQGNSWQIGETQEYAVLMLNGTAEWAGVLLDALRGDRRMSTSAFFLAPQQPPRPCVVNTEHIVIDRQKTAESAAGLESVPWRDGFTLFREGQALEGSAYSLGMWGLEEVSCLKKAPIYICEIAARDTSNLLQTILEHVRNSQPLGLPAPRSTALITEPAPR